MRIYTPLLISTFILAANSTGCAQDPGLHLTIELDEVVPGETFDSVSVEVVAIQREPYDDVQRGSYDFTCRASTTQWSTDEIDFPLEVTVRPGDVVWECVAIRVTARDDGELVIRNEELYCIDLSAGVTREELSLSSRCLIEELRNACQADEVCRAGDCELSSIGEVFDVLPVYLESCDVGG